MLRDVDSTPRVKMEDVARTAGVSVATVSKVVNGRYGVAAGTLTRVQEVIDELGYESSLVAAVAAQPPDQRPRHPRRRVRAVQHRAPQGRVLGGRADTGYELLAYSGGGRRRRVGWERRYLSRLSRHPHRRRHHRHPDGRRRPNTGVPVVAVDPHTGPTGPADRRLRQLRRRRAGHRAPARARATAGSASSADAPTSSPPGCARTGFRTAMAAAGLPVDERLVARRRLPPGDRRRARPRAARPRRPADRGVRRQRPVGHRGDGGRRASSACRCPTTCR